MPGPQQLWFLQEVQETWPRESYGTVAGCLWACCMHVACAAQSKGLFCSWRRLCRPGHRLHWSWNSRSGRRHRAEGAAPDTSEMIAAHFICVQEGLMEAGESSLPPKIEGHICSPLPVTLLPWRCWGSSSSQPLSLPWHSGSSWPSPPRRTRHAGFVTAPALLLWNLPSTRRLMPATRETANVVVQLLILEGGCVPKSHPWFRLAWRLGASLL